MDPARERLARRLLAVAEAVGRVEARDLPLAESLAATLARLSGVEGEQ